MKVTLLDFYADWCGPCKTQHPIVEDVEDEWEDNDDVHFERVDIEANQEQANRFAARSIPTIIVIREYEDKDEEEVFERFVGVTQEDALNTAIEGAIEDDN